ncbi:MAG TPA: hypothetical protein VF173_34745 [Thermoanaerobaculia bacterium]|nr:hypothetical protein [Thermoanaerobaculia bacterium]
MSMSSLWQTITTRFREDAPKLVYAPIPKSRTDAGYDDRPLVPGESYFKIWLTEMFLAHSRDWFAEWQPAVHCSVKLTFNNQPAVNFSSVARAAEDAKVNGVLLNYKLSELMPFNGGDVEIAAGLLALKGKSDLRFAVNLLASFSSLVAPPLGQAIAIADKVAGGVETLIQDTHGEIRLPFHQTFTSQAGGGSNGLRPGYIAVLNADAQTIKPDDLSVRTDRLHYRDQPLTGVDYLLFRIEGRAERDDWRFASIAEPLQQAKTAIVGRDETRAVTLLNQAILAAYNSPDLAEADRMRVISAIKADFEKARGIGYGAAGAQQTDLNEIIRNGAISREESLLLGKPQVERLFVKSEGIA